MLKRAGHAHASAVLCLLLFAAGTGWASAQSNAVLTFADKPTFVSDGTCEFAISDDKRAFDFACSGIEVAVDGGSPPEAMARRARTASATAPIASHAYSFVLPIATGKAVDIPFILSGFALTTQGAGAGLLFRVNGEDTLLRFPAGTDGEFTQTIRYRAKSAAELRVSIFVVAERDSKSAEAAAFLNVIKVDVETAKLQGPASGWKGK